MSHLATWLICCSFIQLIAPLECLALQPLQAKDKSVAASSALNISASPASPTQHHPGPTDNSGLSRIIGGYDAQEGEVPWQVGLRQKDVDILFCGGTLVSSRVVVTAAHCFNSDEDFFVGMGGLVTSSFPIKSQHTDIDIIIHEKYRPSASTPQYDIALIILDRDVTFSSTVQPAALPWYEEDINDVTATTLISGWGHIDNDDNAAETLQVAEVQIWNQKECVDAYKEAGNQVTGDMICAGYFDYSKDSCVGDSGGPLVVNTDNYDILAGITSWGPKGECAKYGFPGVYTRVTSYVSWIREKACDAGHCIPDIMTTTTIQQTDTTAGANDVFTVNALILAMAYLVLVR
ncbi:unnamed protein product [Meganyctiphanes norvegica]|uniref:Peptidase S1 domain-containing protein n=1 Tax=Meganyctiphanes norvegica TaxID=48144 RepID=A0AAV2Q507_MEGNR